MLFSILPILLCFDINELPLNKLESVLNDNSGGRNSIKTLIRLYSALSEYKYCVKAVNPDIRARHDLTDDHLECIERICENIGRTLDRYFRNMSFSSNEISVDVQNLGYAIGEGLSILGQMIFK
jgi:hypothetical protein